VGTGLTVPVWSVLLPVAALLLAMVVAAQQPDGRLHLWVLDVGQGDAILLRTPEGHTALVDGGPGATPLLNGIGERIPFWQRDLDLLVLTHPHQDHMMGFVDVLARYRVDQVVQTHFTATGGVQAEWLRTLESRKLPVHYARRGETFSFEGEPEVRLSVLHPADPRAAYARSGDDVNDASLALRVTYGSHSILLAGDVQEEAEAEMSRLGEGIRSTLLKVAHHGSDTSSSLPFLEAVEPEVAIISVGEGNRFGHPSAETLEALRNVGAEVYRTDEDGTVEIIADREKMWVKPER
jgi:competence protein ComEC